MSITTAREYVQVTPVTPAVGGILAVANVMPASGHNLLGAEYLTDACAEGGIWTDLCYVWTQDCDDISSQPEPTGGFKVFETPELVQGSPFAVYAGVDCPAIGVDDAEATERAKRRLEYTKSRQVDWNVLAAIVADGDTLTLTDAPLAEMMAEAEDLAGALYGGYATILLSKGQTLKAYAAELIERAPDGGLHTVNGTRVGNVSVPTGTTEDIYLTGQITLIEGPVQDHIVGEVIRPDGTCTPRRALAERMYVPLIECLQFVGTVTEEGA